MSRVKIEIIRLIILVLIIPVLIFGTWLLKRWVGFEWAVLLWLIGIHLSIWESKQYENRRKAITGQSFNGNRERLIEKILTRK
ncbi:hypothetical protein LCGC14_0609160 [marine sediment metagenome]|uniref:Uncharacterized protein n=1 Tax=marine sediment metagenome TaxID=412755 RepID=A0A0F9UGT4_9ZZZZ